MENGTAAVTAADAWVPKQEAAAFLGVSVRQLERLAARGYCEVETRGRDRGRGKMAVYSRVDLLAYKAGSPNQHAVPVESVDPAAGGAPQSPAGSPLALVRSPKGGDDVRSVALYLAQLVAGATAAAPAPARPWLSVEEAAEFSGLPAAFLRRQAAAGVPWVVNVGTDERPRWRFNRDALARPIAPGGLPPASSTV
jgi:hypothetical protein